MQASLARGMWSLLEPIHATVYFAPEVHDACKRAGLKGFWMGYFAGRAAPMGAVSAAVVTATFGGFAPAMVARAIPDAWRFVAPERLIGLRRDAIALALDRILGPVDAASIREAAALLRTVSEHADRIGRPLFSAHAALDWPTDPVLELWHATTLLREQRGDAHVSELARAGLAGCQAHVLKVATGAVPRETLQPNRGWNDADWADAEAALRSRRWLTDEGTLTDLGMQAESDIEAETDRLAIAPWSEIDADAIEQVRACVGPLVERVIAAEAVPYPNPMGVPPPTNGRTQ